MPFNRWTFVQEFTGCLQSNCCCCSVSKVKDRVLAAGKGKKKRTWWSWSCLIHPLVSKRDKYQDTVYWYFLNVFLCLLIELRSLSSTVKLLQKQFKVAENQPHTALKNIFITTTWPEKRHALWTVAALMQCNAHLQPTTPSPNKTPAAWLVNWLTELSWNPFLLCLFLTVKILSYCLLSDF